jgi:hypothetical protein
LTASSVEGLTTYLVVSITTYGKTAEEAEDKWRAKIAEIDEEEHEQRLLEEAAASLC